MSPSDGKKAAPTLALTSAYTFISEQARWTAFRIAFTIAA